MKKETGTREQGIRFSEMDFGKVRTQDAEKFDEEVKSLVTAWYYLFLSFLLL